MFMYSQHTLALGQVWSLEGIRGRSGPERERAALKETAVLLHLPVECTSNQTRLEGELESVSQQRVNEASRREEQQH